MKTLTWSSTVCGGAGSAPLGSWGLAVSTLKLSSQASFWSQPQGSWEMTIHAPTFLLGWLLGSCGNIQAWGLWLCWEGSLFHIITFYQQVNFVSGEAWFGADVSQGRQCHLGTSFAYVGLWLLQFRMNHSVQEKVRFSGYSTVNLPLHTLPTREEHCPEINTLKLNRKTILVAFKNKRHSMNIPSTSFLGTCRSTF